jgi:hypothetical protein
MKKTLFLSATLVLAAFAGTAEAQIDTRPNIAVRTDTAAGQRAYNRIVAAGGPREAVDVGRDAGSKAAGSLKGYAGRLGEKEIERRGRLAATKAGFDAVPVGDGERRRATKGRGNVQGTRDEFIAGYVAGFLAAAKK